LGKRGFFGLRLHVLTQIRDEIFFLLIFISAQLEILLIVVIVVVVLRVVSRRAGHGSENGGGSVIMSSTTDRILLVIGDDKNLQVDLAALRKVRSRTGLEFTRLLPASFMSLENHLSRVRRQNRGETVKYVHMAVHSSPSGIKLDVIVDPVELSSVLDGVRILVLDGCKSTAIGDLLGVVPYVVTMLETIRHDHAAQFAEAFWMEIGMSGDPVIAYGVACDVVPVVSEFSFLHT